MSKYTLHAEELAEEILKTLEGSGLLKAGSDKDGAVVNTLSRLMVSAGFPEKDVLTKNITILLSDIRGFSQIAEAHTARDVVALLNRYFDCMGNIITQYGGTIGKLMGDSIMVVFGIPNAKADDI
jgi:adenylate cyclase